MHQMRAVAFKNRIFLQNCSRKRNFVRFRHNVAKFRIFAKMEKGISVFNPESRPLQEFCCTCFCSVRTYQLEEEGGLQNMGKVACLYSNIKQQK
jgi:hypothetical protein